LNFITVRILVGRLRGLIGTVIRRGDRDHFVVSVRFLGRRVTVDLQDWQVEPAVVRSDRSAIEAIDWGRTE
jgi:hypothetical protein